MKHNKKNLMCLFLALALLVSLMTPCFALEPETSEEETAAPGNTLYIVSEKQFLLFAERCRTDSYSKDLTVILNQDLDLSNLDFESIPLFLGTFLGNHHTIKGLCLTDDGSNQGLFRFLGERALVKDLTVIGTVAPEGSRLNIGGIAGTNAGTIENCRFEGSLSGADRIGGIAGVNALTGRILSCHAKGSLSADHFAGGIAGENKGTIRNSVSWMDVNTTVRDSKINVKSISMETITGTEDPNTVTDIGGIAGTSVGVIRDCINRGQVGYPHMGYNIGGIAGSQVGYIDSCQNYGSIYGRKEVGGIVGQFEPISKIEYKIDTLQILQEQLDGASSLLNRAAYNAQGNLGVIGSAIGDMWIDAEDARDALDQIRPGEIPDRDTLIAAHNALKNSIHSMHVTMSNVGDAASAAAGQLGEDMRAITSQMNAMSRTIREANEHMGVRLSDVSDQDTELDYSGKVSNCRNFASVDGDLNAGGIAGSIAYENDLDPEDDLKTAGDRSLNFEGSLRAVILNCENQGTISAKKLQAGGIVGWMSMGLVKSSLNTGVVHAESAQYVGGIAGNSRGYIRSCHVKCELLGSTCVGGIAGSGTIVSDCLSMINIRSGEEKLGGILGIQEPSQDEEIDVPVERNLYMSFTKDMGAIDGISYDGLAQPVSPYQLKNLPDLPGIFQQVTLIFEAEPGSMRKRVVLPIGSELQPETIPEVPEKPGYNGFWENIENIQGQPVYFDMVLPAVYNPHHITIASPQRRDNGRPILLAEGTFPDVEEIELRSMGMPKLSGKHILEAWWIPHFSTDQITELHLNQPENTDITRLRILIQRQSGDWEEAETVINARHLVFSVEPGDQGFCVAETPNYPMILKAVCGTAGAILVIALLILRKQHKIKKSRAEK